MPGCWKGYEARGSKTSHRPSKGDPPGKGHKVNNCVPVKKAIKK